ncbi:MAG: hypothetical protein V9E90_13325 [Saprospiraceae bacterium]|jgi:hypothetical protein
MDELEIIRILQTAFENDNIKKQVLEPNWYQLNIETGIASTGFCFSASEVLFRLTGQTQNWMLKSINDPAQWNNGTHYFLERRQNKEIVDITSDQYTRRDITIPYHLSKGKGLRNISNKARLLARLSGLGEL